MAANPAGTGGSRPRRDRPKVQAQRLERLERRKEAGKDINEERLEKLQAKAETTTPNPKLLKRLDEIITGMYGGPGQEMSATAVLKLFEGDDELKNAVATFILENRGKYDEGGYMTLGEALMQQFPQIRAAYLEGMGKYINPETHQVLPIGVEGGGKGVAYSQHEAGTGPLRTPVVEPRAAILESFDLLDDESLWTVNFALQQLMQARQQRINAMTFQSPYFGLDETMGVE